MFTHPVEQLAHVFSGWSALYAGSRVLPTITQATHLLGMLFGGGFAVAADRATLRATRRDPAARQVHLQELSTMHRPVVIALIVAFVSGVALAAADIETFATSYVFWVKLALVVVLLLNGLMLLRTESALRSPGAPDADPAALAARTDRLWRRLHIFAVMSVLLWCATLIAGTVLVNAP